MSPVNTRVKPPIALYGDWIPEEALERRIKRDRLPVLYRMQGYRDVRALGHMGGYRMRVWWVQTTDERWFCYYTRRDGKIERSTFALPASEIIRKERCDG